MRVAVVAPETVHHLADRGATAGLDVAADGGRSAGTDADPGADAAPDAGPGPGADDGAVDDGAGGGGDSGVAGAGPDGEATGAGGATDEGAGARRPAGPSRDADRPGTADEGSVLAPATEAGTPPESGAAVDGAQLDAEATCRLDALARALDARGHDVVWVCRPWWEGSIREFEDDRDGVGITYRGVPEGRGGFSVRVPLALRRVDPDVVHAAGWAPGATIAAAAPGRLLGGRPVLAEWYAPEAGRSLVRRAVDAADLHAAPSRLAARWVREAGADAGDVEVVPTPVDLDLVGATPPDPEYDGDIVYARRLDGGANLESLLLGLAELREYDWTATVVGDGPARAGYERQAADLRIDDRVRFVGARPRTERVGIYRAAHAFVQTARQSVFAGELLWALCCGCVGVVEYHAAASAHELVEHRDRGYRITSPEELADVFPEVGDHERLDRDHEFDEFGRAAVLERYLACYRDLIG